jgi:hypothetical protein
MVNLMLNLAMLQIQNMIEIVTSFLIEMVLVNLITIRLVQLELIVV